LISMHAASKHAPAARARSSRPPMRQRDLAM
jgi:hypothetical protein